VQDLQREAEQLVESPDEQVSPCIRVAGPPRPAPSPHVPGGSAPLTPRPAGGVGAGRAGAAGDGAREHVLRRAGGGGRRAPLRGPHTLLRTFLLCKCNPPTVPTCARAQVRAAVECVAAMHHERLAKRRSAAGGAQPPPAPAKPPAAREDPKTILKERDSPTSSTALLWAPRAAPRAADAAGAAETADAGVAENERDDTEEEGEGGAARAAARAVAACFERWRREALGWRAPPPPPRALADYLGDEFLAEVPLPPPLPHAVDPSPHPTVPFPLLALQSPPCVSHGGC